MLFDFQVTGVRDSEFSALRPVHLGKIQLLIVLFRLVVYMGWFCVGRRMSGVAVGC